MEIRKKIFKLAGKYFPLNSVRIWAFRKAGYSIGKQVYIGEELHITDDLSGPSNTNFIVGDRVSIAQRVMVILASDPNWSRLSSKVKIIRGTVRLESDAWIGAGSIILPNITIGEQAIVGAGSVVTKDVAPRTIVTGNPAKFLREVSIKHE